MEQVKPELYNILLKPDLHNFIFDGDVTIQFQRMGEVDSIILDALDLNIKSCMLSLADKQIDLHYELSLEMQELVIDLPVDITIPEEFSINIKYTGEINDKLAGLYRSSYQVNGETNYVAITQFQESDARRAFPSIDRPGVKAKFEISFELPADLYPISNTSIHTEEPLENGNKLVSFERTPMMSTYLVFFGFGDFEYIEENYRGIPVRVLSTPGKAKDYGEFGLEFGIKSLQYCEEFFDIAYPLSKLDLIAIAAFAAGAMENWGAITFRENLLLNIPGVTSQSNQVRIKEVVAHEVTHQWFGNLVTPATWKYVWLNESFATFFAYNTIDHFEPDFGIWDFFVNSETSVALDADAYLETAPIEMEGEKRVAYTTITVPILYNKGGSVLRQVKAYLGDDDFREGLRYFLSKYEYGVATSNDLWLALQEVSGKPITDMMESWVLQMGYPLIEVSRENNTLHLSQRRFTYLENSDDKIWFVPISVIQYFEDKDPVTTISLLDTKSGTIELDDDTIAFKINSEQTGFYRIKYEAEDWQKLGNLVLNREIGAIDRWSLENDYYALLRAGEVSFRDYLEFLKYYTNETNHLPINSITTHMDTLYALLDDPAKSNLADVGRKFLENVLNRIKFEPQEDEPHTIAMIRGKLVRVASLFGLQEATDFAMEKFTDFKDGNEINADIYPNILQVAARQTKDLDWFVNKFETAENEVEKIYYSLAVAAINDDEALEKIQYFIINEVPSRNRASVINILSTNEVAKPSLWHWYLANLDNFEKLHQFIYQNSLTTIISNSEDYEKEMHEFFEDYVKKNESIADSVSKAMENVQINATLKSSIQA